VRLDREADRLYATTDASGRFSFKQVTPGPYWLATGSDGFAEQYYPVVADQDEVSIIYVRPGEDVENVAFYVPEEAVRRTVRVKVVQDDGSPAAGARVALRPMRREDPRGVEMTADASGQVEFNAFAESAYVLTAIGGQGIASRLVGTLEIPAGSAAVTGTVELRPGSPRTAER
jgi:hypothetical protein